MNTDEQHAREAFEAWARELEYDLRPMSELHPSGGDTYISPTTENVWSAWKAAWLAARQQQWRPSSAPDGECKHDWLRAWRDAKTGEAVPLWSCVYCNRRFEPVPAQPVEAPQREGGAG